MTAYIVIGAIGLVIGFVIGWAIAYGLGEQQGFREGWDAYGGKLIEQMMKEGQEPKE